MPCVAIAKRTGTRCRRFAMPSGRFCRYLRHVEMRANGYPEQRGSSGPDVQGQSFLLRDAAPELISERGPLFYPDALEDGTY